MTRPRNPLRRVRGSVWVAAVAAGVSVPLLAVSASTLAASTAPTPASSGPARFGPGHPLRPRPRSVSSGGSARSAAGTATSPRRRRTATPSASRTMRPGFLNRSCGSAANRTGSGLAWSTACPPGSTPAEMSSATARPGKIRSAGSGQGTGSSGCGASGPDRQPRRHQQSWRHRRRARHHRGAAGRGRQHARRVGERAGGRVAVGSRPAAEACLAARRSGRQRVRGRPPRPGGRGLRGHPLPPGDLGSRRAGPARCRAWTVGTPPFARSALVAWQWVMRWPWTARTTRWNGTRQGGSPTSACHRGAARHRPPRSCRAASWWARRRCPWPAAVWSRRPCAGCGRGNPSCSAGGRAWNRPWWSAPRHNRRRAIWRTPKAAGTR